MIYKMELSDSVDTMVFDLLEVPIVDKDITGIAENTTIDGNVFNDYLWLKKQYVQKWSIMCQDEYDRLRGFWTRQFGNAEVPFYRLFYGENVYEDKNFLTSDGFTQIMNPTERTAPLSLTHLYGNATQKTLSGKNLLDFKSAEYYTVWKASYTKTDTTLNVQATEGNIYASVAYKTFDCVQGTTYTFSMKATKPSTAGAVPNARLGKNTNASADIISLCTSTLQTGNYYLIKHTFTADSSFTLNISFYPNYGSVDIASSTFYDVQLETGSTATDFQEYVGGIPSPNPDYPQAIKTVTGAQTVEVVGKNIFNTRTQGTPSANVTTTVTSDNSITLYNSGTSGWLYSPFRIDGLKKNTQYTLKYNQSNTNTAMVNWLSIRTLGLVDISNGNYTSGSNRTFNTGENTSLLFCFYVQTGAGTVAENTATITNIQLELGSSTSSYTPYQGSQSYEINLGKNLIPFTNQDFTANGVRFYVQNGALYLDGTCTSETLTSHTQFKNNFAFTLEAGTYTFSMGTDGTLRPMSLKKYSDDSNISSLSSVQMQTTFTLSERTQVYIGFYLVSSNSYSDTKYEVQIERGSIKTEFSPYLTPIELAKIGTYRDYIWNDDGTWKIHKETGKKVFDGSESWSNTEALVLYTDSISDYSRSDNTPMSNYFTGADNVGGAGSTPMNRMAFAKASITSDRLYIRYPSLFSTTSALTTWLGTHNTTVYYALATPTDTEITDIELIEQLNHIYSLYQGQNNLWLIPSAGAQGEIDGTYRLIYDEETDIIPKTPVVLTLADGGVINPCGCRQNIQLIMRETEGE